MIPLNAVLGKVSIDTLSRAPLRTTAHNIKSILVTELAKSLNFALLSLSIESIIMPNKKNFQPYHSIVTIKHARGVTTTIATV